MLTAVDQTGQNLVKIIHGLLVEGYQVVKIFLGKTGFLGLRHTKKFRIVGRHVFHVILDSV